MSRSKSRRSAPAALTYANLRLHAARNSCGQTPDNSEESCNSTTTAYSAVFATDDNNNNSSKNNGNFDLSDSGSSSIRYRLKRKCSINVSYTDDDTLYPVEEAKKYKKRGRPRKKAAAAADLPTPVVRYNDNLQQVDQSSIAFRKNLSVVELESYIKSRWGGLLNFDDKKNKKKRKRKTTTTTITTTKKRKKSNKAAVELPVAVVEYNEALRDRGPELPKPIIDYNNNLGKAVVDESSNVSSTTACAASEPLDHRPDFVARLSELRAILPALAAHLQSYEMLDAAGDYVDCLIVLFHYLDKREARISSSMMTMVEEMRRQETVAAFDEKVRRGYEVYLTLMGQ